MCVASATATDRHAEHGANVHVARQSVRLLEPAQLGREPREPTVRRVMEYLSANQVDREALR